MSNEIDWWLTWQLIFAIWCSIGHIVFLASVAMSVGSAANRQKNTFSTNIFAAIIVTVLFILIWPLIILAELDDE